MAKETKAESVKPEEVEQAGAVSVEDLQREILRVELETKRLQLDQAKKANAEFKEHEDSRHRANLQRMKELEDGRANRFAVIKACRHHSGGSPTDILRGGKIGSFSLITQAIMPDGVTMFLQCPRCRLQMYTPNEKQRQLWFTSYAEELEFYRHLLEQSIEEGIQHNITRGPTFMFKNREGVPIIPERV